MATFNMLECSNKSVTHAFFQLIGEDLFSLDSERLSKLEIEVKINGKDYDFVKVVTTLYSCYDQDVESVAALMVKEKCEDLTSLIHYLKDKISQEVEKRFPKAIEPER